MRNRIGCGGRVASGLQSAGGVHSSLLAPEVLCFFLPPDWLVPRWLAHLWSVTAGFEVLKRKLRDWSPFFAFVCSILFTATTCNGYGPQPDKEVASKAAAARLARRHLS